VKRPCLRAGGRGTTDLEDGRDARPASKHGEVLGHALGLPVHILALALIREVAYRALYLRMQAVAWLQFARGPSGTMALWSSCAGYFMAKRLAHEGLRSRCVCRVEARKETSLHSRWGVH